MGSVSQLFFFLKSNIILPQMYIHTDQRLMFHSEVLCLLTESSALPLLIYVDHASCSAGHTVAAQMLSLLSKIRFSA